MEKRLLTTSEVCELLRISRYKLYDLVAAGYIECVKFGTRSYRYPVEQFDDLMNLMDGWRNRKRLKVAR
jgi:excisionase family DNA binding protein